MPESVPLLSVAMEKGKGTDANIANQSGYTALHLAALEGKEEMAEILIAGGAGVNAPNKEGIRPLDVARIYGKDKVVALLEKHGGRGRSG